MDDLALIRVVHAIPRKRLDGGDGQAVLCDHFRVIGWHVVVGSDKNRIVKPPHKLTDKLGIKRMPQSEIAH